MRYIVNSNNYVTHVSFGCPLVVGGSECTEYTGNVPDGYESLEKWYLEEELTLWRWKIIDGNLAFDSSATAPKEGEWGIPDLQSKEVAPKTTAQTVKPDSGYDGLSQVKVGAMPSGTLSAPDISVNELGIITAISAVDTSGYLPSGTSAKDTLAMGTRAADTVTPGTSPKIAVAKNKYTTGDVYVAGDSNLAETNIRSGVSIFGVTGSYTGGKIGSAVSANSAGERSIKFNVSTDNLIGFYIYTGQYDNVILNADSNNGSVLFYIEGLDKTITGGLYDGSGFKFSYYHAVLTSSNGLDILTLIHNSAASGVSVSVSNGTIILTSSTYKFITNSVKLIPVYAS